MTTSSAPNPLANVRALAAADPARVALVFEGQPTEMQSLTYGQAQELSSAVANGLFALAAAPQSRIALLDFNYPNFVEIFLGALKAGHALCPINARLAPPEVAWIINDSRAPILFVGRDHYAAVEQIESQLLHVKKFVALHGSHARWESYTDWRAHHTTDDPLTSIHPDDDIVQLYTSGTTGHPKGVRHTHHTWSSAAASAATALPHAFAPDSVNLAAC